MLIAWKLFVSEKNNFKGNDGFEYDLVDISRQVLANYAQVILKNIKKAYDDKDKLQLDEECSKFLELIDEQDKLLGSIESLTLGNWIKEARSAATNKKEEDLFEYNARVQITTWSFQNSNLHEYSHREWSGLLRDFYKPRWKMFFDYLEKEMAGEELEVPDYYSFEEQWTKETKVFEPSTVDATEAAAKLYDKYFTVISKVYDGL